MTDFISTIVPDPKALLSLEPPELAGVLLQYLNSLPPPERNVFSRHNLFISTIPLAVGYPPEHHDTVREALMEGWSWLEREGLIAHKPGHGGDWYFISLRVDTPRLAASVVINWGCE